MMVLTRNRMRRLISDQPNSEQSERVVPRFQKAKTVDCTLGAMEGSAGSSKWAPRYWGQHLENIRKMRAGADAPVDTMGAAACQDTTADPKTRRFQVLLSLMLSSQTKDEVTSAAMSRLIQHGCTVEALHNASLEDIQNLIYPVGFWKKKAEYIQKCVSILQCQYDSDIPNSVSGLCKLPGVGPKMAHLTMQIAWKESTGIGVDTHVHRISNRLGWVRKETKTPEETRIALEDWLPKSEWGEVNKLLVGFGQQMCTPTKPKCEDCLNRNLCPYAIQHF